MTRGDWTPGLAADIGRAVRGAHGHVPVADLHRLATEWRHTAATLATSTTRVPGETALRQAADKLEQLCRVAEQHAAPGEQP